MKRPIPDDLWQPLQRRVETCHVIARVSAWLVTVAGLLTAVDLIARPTSRDFTIYLRLILPLAFLGWVSGKIARRVAQRTLERLRQIIIDHGGHDPGER